MKRTPAARALIGALALADGATTNQAFKLAGYGLVSPLPDGSIRSVIRNGRLVAMTRNAYAASLWLTRLGRKLVALGVGRERAA